VSAKPTKRIYRISLVLLLKGMRGGFHYFSIFNAFCSSSHLYVRQIYLFSISKHTQYTKGKRAAAQCAVAALFPTEKRLFRRRTLLRGFNRRRTAAFFHQYTRDKITSRPFPLSNIQKTSTHSGIDPHYMVPISRKSGGARGTKIFVLSGDLKEIFCCWKTHF